MDIQLICNTPVEHTFEGREFVFGRMHLMEYAHVQDTLWKRQRGRLDVWATLLTKHGLSVDQIPALIRQLEHEPTMSEVIDYIRSPHGIVDVLRMGAKMAPKPWSLGDADVALLGPPTQVAALASSVANLDYYRRLDEAKKLAAKDDDEDDKSGPESVAPLADTSTDDPLSGNTPSSVDTTVATP